ncbi:MAG: MBOAT family protein [Bacteroidetes bacterium]|nr:MBOAT family protein [Bacteroidota bacterium]
MLFNSLQFLIFFPVVTTLYFLLPHRYRWMLLLLASCIFYMAFIPIYILILVVTIVIDYLAGIYIEKSEGRKRKHFLILSIISTCLVLFIFKYFNFFNDNFRSIAQALDLRYPINVINIILPIGLSFHTFQSLSYVVEVYKGRQKAEKNFGIYSLYVMFYPQLVAGPIERPQNLLHQFYEKHDFEYNRVVDGLKQMAWGFFKKVVIADRVSVVVNQVYNHPANYQGLPLIIATFLFAVQIYCDFSGYSNIAIGAAKVMGFKLMTNFDRPYFSKSISEFWKRWHISLSTWFRDYLYIPLGGNRVSKPRWYFNLFITFLVSGLWHGANWTFVIWGGLHGAYLILAIQTQKFRNKITSAFGISKTSFLQKSQQILFTLVLVIFAWIFFRANNLKDAIYIVTHLFSNFDELMKNWHNVNFLKGYLSGLGISMSEFYRIVIFLLILFVVEVIQGRLNIINYLNQRPGVVRWSIYYLMIILIIFFGAFNQVQQFIYFQF